jgi:hypothetical protein
MKVEELVAKKNKTMAKLNSLTKQWLEVSGELRAIRSEIMDIKKKEKVNKYVPRKTKR